MRITNLHTLRDGCPSRVLAGASFGRSVTSRSIQFWIFNPYATTSPVYANVAGALLRSREDAAYFVSWMERLILAAKSGAAWNTETEKQDVLALFEKAREKYKEIAKAMSQQNVRPESRLQGLHSRRTNSR
jgi:hypothetical protein